MFNPLLPLSHSLLPQRLLQLLPQLALHLIVRQTPNRDSLRALLPVSRLRDRVLEVRRRRRGIGLHLSGISVLDGDGGVVQEVGAGALLDGEEAARELVEEEAEVV